MRRLLRKCSTERTAPSPAITVTGLADTVRLFRRVHPHGSKRRLLRLRTNLLEKHSTGREGGNGEGDRGSVVLPGGDSLVLAAYFLLNNVFQTVFCFAHCLTRFPSIACSCSLRHRELVRPWFPRQHHCERRTLQRLRSDGSPSKPAIWKPRAGDKPGYRPFRDAQDQR